jgi:hypothetical protein
MLEYGASYKMADEFAFLDIAMIRAEAGSEFTSASFKQFLHNTK